MFAGGDDAGIGQVGEVEGQGVVRRAQFFAQGTGGQTGGASLYQQAKGAQAGLLGEGVKHDESVLYVHMSRLVDISRYVNIYGHINWQARSAP